MFYRVWVRAGNAIRPEQVPLHLHPHPISSSERAIWDDILTLNLNEVVEINDDPNRKTKKYMTKDGNIIFGPFLDWDTDDEELKGKTVAELKAELDELNAKNPLQPPTLEEMIQDSRQAYSEIDMFDYGTGKMSNMQAMADFYGWAIVHQIEEEKKYCYNHRLEDQPTGHISKNLWQEIKDIRAGRLPKPKPVKYKDKCKGLRPKPEPTTGNKESAESNPRKKEKPKIEVIRRERQKGDDYFLPLERGIVRNETYRKLFKGPGVVYEWLWANIVRDQWRDTKAYPIKEKYYDNGFLAYCSTYGKIAKECGMSKTTVITYIKDFVKAKIIETELLVPEGKKQGQTVFILGTWAKVKGEIKETYFRDSVFITPKPSKK